MDQYERLAEQFEEQRPHLQAVAYQMLGSLSEAHDAVQEAWLHLSRSDANVINNLGGWLTTVVARICLDMLRTRKARREESLEASETISPTADDNRSDPEQEALLADSVGVALLVVLNTLSPSERLAFVLHDIFAVPFDEIAKVVDRSETAARQLASRARRRVRGGASAQDNNLSASREVVEAFLTAAHEGSFDTLLAVLDPDVIFRQERASGAARQILGAQAVAKQFSGRAHGARLALVNGAVGIIVAPLGHLYMVLNLTITNDKITRIDVISDPEQLRQLQIAVLPD